jgi:hypothetical protein
MLGLVAVSSGMAQNDTQDIDPDEKKSGKRRGKKDEDVVETTVVTNSDIKTRWGIYGNATSGLSYGTFGVLEERMASSEAIGQTFETNHIGSQYGGNIWGQIGNRFLIAVGGQGFNYTYGLDAKDSIAHAGVSAGMFTGTLGFIVYQKYKVVNYRYGDSIYIDKGDGGERLKTILRPDFRYHWCLFPYVGVGFGSSDLKVSNYSPKNFNFGSQVVERQTSLQFNSSMLFVDFGVGVRFRKNKKGGLMLGAELGGFLNVGSGEWKNTANDAVVRESADPNAKPIAASLAGGYLRLTVGGGFFSVSDPSEKQGAKAAAQKDDAYVEPSAVESGKKKANKKTKKAADQPQPTE